MARACLRRRLGSKGSRPSRSVQPGNSSVHRRFGSARPRCPTEGYRDDRRELSYANHDGRGRQADARPRLAVDCTSIKIAEANACAVESSERTITIRYPRRLPAHCCRSRRSTANGLWLPNDPRGKATTPRQLASLTPSPERLGDRRTRAAHARGHSGSAHALRVRPRPQARSRHASRWQDGRSRVRGGDRPTRHDHDRRGGRVRPWLPRNDRSPDGQSRRPDRDDHRAGRTGSRIHLGRGAAARVDLERPGLLAPSRAPSTTTSASRRRRSAATRSTSIYDDDGLLTNAGDLSITRNGQGAGLVTATEIGTVTTSETPNAYAELDADEARISGTPVYANSYPSRDALGRITAKTETLQGATAHYGYTYTPAGQLDVVTIDGTPVRDYDYDANGNRTHVNGALVGAYDAQDRLTSYQGTTYTYTAAGDLETKIDAAGTTTYAYDALGNLRTATPSPDAAADAHRVRDRRAEPARRQEDLPRAVRSGGRRRSPARGTSHSTPPSASGTRPSCRTSDTGSARRSRSRRRAAGGAARRGRAANSTAGRARARSGARHRCAGARPPRPRTRSCRGVGVDAVLREQRAADVGLQRREAQPRVRVVLEQEAHGAVAQVADAVEEHDRVPGGVGRAHASSGAGSSARDLDVGLQRRLLAQPLDRVGRLGALSLEVALDRVREARVGEEVRAPGRLRVEAAHLLVVAAGAGLEAGEAVFDAVCDAGVVADGEVQVLDVLGGAPVAAVEGVALLDVRARRRSECRRAAPSRRPGARGSARAAARTAPRSGRAGPTDCGRWSRDRSATSARTTRRGWRRPRASRCGRRPLRRRAARASPPCGACGAGSRGSRRRSPNLDCTSGTGGRGAASSRRSSGRRTRLRGRS